MLYNFVLVHPLFSRFLKNYNPAPGTLIHILLDKRLGSRAESSLGDYMEDKYHYLRDAENWIDYDIRLRLKQVSSQEEPLIWVADYVAGSIYTRFEHEESKYVSIIKDLIFDCAYFWEGPQMCKEYLGVE